MSRPPGARRHRGAACFVALIASLLVAACGPADSDRSGPPSVLLISIDTLRPDYLSLNGYDRETTPFLDELLASGFYFERAVSPIARTTQALASLLTGAYPHRTGVRKLTDALSDDVATLAEALREHGYARLAVVSNSMLVKTRRLNRGFQIYDLGSSERTAQRTTAAALDYLELADRSRPLFAWVHYFDPHVPYHSDSAIAEAFDPGYSGPYALRFGRHVSSANRAAKGRGYPEDLPKEIATHGNSLPDAVNAHIRRLYAADIRATDEALRELVSGFRAAFGGRLLVVVTADHGESLGEHDFYFDHGDYVYNAGTRVPLGFVLPEGHPVRGRGRCDQWVSLVDVLPTLLELLALEPGPRMREQIEGRSLVPCMRGEDLAAEPVFAEAGHSWFIRKVPRRKLNDIPGRFRSVTLGDWKLIWTPLQSEDLAWELYDLRDDPDETRNLYRPDHPQLEPLRRRLSEWTNRAGALPPARPVSDDDRERLRALGYAE